MMTFAPARGDTSGDNSGSMLWLSFLPRARVFNPHKLPEVRASTSIVAEEEPTPRQPDYESIVRAFQAHPDYVPTVHGDRHMTARTA